MRTIVDARLGIWEERRDDAPALPGCGCKSRRAGDDEVKSVSNEMSFAVSLATRDQIGRALATMAAKVCRRLRKKGLKAHTLALKVRYENLKIRTAQLQLPHGTDDEYEVMQALDPLIDGLWTRGMLVRLVGVAASGFDEPASMVIQDQPLRSGDVGESSDRQFKTRSAPKNRVRPHSRHRQDPRPLRRTRRELRSRTPP